MSVITREEFLEEMLWEFINNDEHGLWQDHDGDGYQYPWTVEWKCGCEEDGGQKWRGPVWSQTSGDPQPTIDEVLHKWINHIREPKPLYE